MQTTSPVRQVVNSKEVGAKFINSRTVAVVLLLLDIVGLIICTATSYFLNLGQFEAWVDGVFILFSVLIFSALYLGDAYKPESKVTRTSSIVRVIVSVAGLAVIAFPLMYLINRWTGHSFSGVRIWLPSLAFFTGWAVICRLVAANFLKRNLKERQWLLISHNNFQNYIADFERLDPQGKFTILSNNSEEFLGKINEEQITGIDSARYLNQYLSKRWTGIIVAESEKLSESEINSLISLRSIGLPILSQDRFYEQFAFKIPPSSLNDNWFAFGDGFALFRERFRNRFKRLLDVTFTVILLAALTPLMALVALLIKIDSPGPIFYSQVRTGFHSKPFRVYKFRSMVQNSEKGKVQWAQKNDARVTRVGYWIRLLRIDELPQFWNVLKGEMSLIGPRPERPEFDMQLETEIPFYRTRYMVKPGITGWAQVMYPYGASIDDSYEKLAYDLYYIKNFSFYLDFAIILKTVRIVFLGKGR